MSQTDENQPRADADADASAGTDSRAQTGVELDAAEHEPVALVQTPAADREDQPRALIRVAGTRSDEPPLLLASSLQSAKIGELLVLDREGSVIDPKSRRRRMAGSWGVWVGLSTALAITWGLLFNSIFLGGLLGAWMFALPFWRRREFSRIRRAVALVAAGERDRARVALDQVLASDPPRAFLPTLLFLRSKVEWQSGRFEQALEQYTATMDRLRGQRKAHDKIMYWASAFDRVQLLAVMGRLEQARTAREDLEQAPTGDYFRMERMLCDLMIAFHGNSLEELPDLDTLYDWAKEVLLTSQFGVAVVLLAWVFDRHGEHEMTEHLLSEAPERLQATFFAEAAPALHAWMAERTQSDDGDGDSG
jgi:tetratricopeptide (TPR) repeat protein